MNDNNENAIFILIDILKRYKSIFVAAVMVTSLTGLIYALLATSLYRADVTIISNQAEGEALSSLARQYSSLAQIAGINVGGDSPVTDTDRSLAILTSRSFIEEFAIKRNIRASALMVSRSTKSPNSASSLGTSVPLGKIILAPFTIQLNPIAYPV